MRLILLLLAVIAGGCGDSTRQPLESTKKLVVLTRVGSTTYSVDETNGATGFDYDLVRMFAKELGLKIRIVVAASDSDILLRLKKRRSSHGSRVAVAG
ncbi:MAG: hypothetical protein IPN98_13290 [Propionivibrio sp.]|nr:hypothetical protein [Propionivibrio sp.]